MNIKSNRIMEEQKKELNLVEILKDCPKGTKLYSTIFGEVEFENIDHQNKEYFPIYFRKCEILESVTKEGLHLIGHDGECTLFPSKDNRDWSTFRIPFKDGDFIYSESADKYLWISIFKEYFNDGQKTHVDLCVKSNIIYTDSDAPFCNRTDDEVEYQRLATDEEKQQLLEALHSEGYNWNAEAKKIEKIEEDKPKWNPDTLQPFDKVLIRDDDSQYWIGNLYLYTDKETDSEYPYSCINDSVKYCIPYNDETKHLLGTNQEAPEYYRL